MKFRWKKWAAVGCVVLVGMLAVQIVRLKPSPIRYPTPNGFDDLLKAAEMLQPLPDKSQDPAQLNVQERKWLIQSNSAALNRLHDGLGKEILVVIPRDLAARDPIQYLAGIKKLSQLLAAKAGVAAASSNQTALLSACFDNYELGCKGTRGGRWIEGLVGVAVRSIALTSMSHIQDLGDATLCRKAAALLSAAATNAPTALAYERGEDAWLATQPLVYRWNPGRLKNWLTGETKQTRLKFLSKFDRLQKQEAETLRDLAAAAFRMEHQRGATNWTELVPEYLPEIPRNATNNTPLPLTGG
jgi:hypothetical protein